MQQGRHHNTQVLSIVNGFERIPSRSEQSILGFQHIARDTRVQATAAMHPVGSFGSSDRASHGSL